MDGVRIPRGRVPPGADVRVAAALLLRLQEHAAVSAPDECGRGPETGGVPSTSTQEAGKHVVSQLLCWRVGRTVSTHRITKLNVFCLFVFCFVLLRQSEQQKKLSVHNFGTCAFYE